MSARVDIHRPSVIVPTDYEFVAYDYIKIEHPGDCQALIAARALVTAHMARTGGTRSTHEHGGNCHICGAHCLYTAMFWHRPSNTYIRTGLDCADKMELDGAGGELFRKRMSNYLEAKAGKNKAQAFLASVDLESAWTVYNDRGTVSPEDRSRNAWRRNTVSDIVGKLVQYGSISDKQTAFLRKLITELATPPAPVGPESQYQGVVGERRTWTATVVFKSSYESAYGRQYVTGLRDAGNNLLIVKGSNPLGHDFRGPAIEKKDVVTFKATVKAHQVYSDTKQTVLNRAKVESTVLPDAAPASVAASPAPVAAPVLTDGSKRYTPTGERIWLVMCDRVNGTVDTYPERFASEMDAARKALALTKAETSEGWLQPGDSIYVDRQY